MNNITVGFSKEIMKLKHSELFKKRKIKSDNLKFYAQQK